MFKTFDKPKNQINIEVLSEEELKNIVDQSGIEDIIIKSWYKDFLNFCPKGRMDKNEFNKFYTILRGKSDNDRLSKIIDHLFNSFDQNSNGYLDFSEFLIAYAVTSNGEMKKKLDFVFLFYDRDKDGLINDVEFLHGIESIYEFRGKNKKEYSPIKCVRDVFQKIDQNGDYKLNKSEFVEGCLKNKNILELLSPYDS